MLCGIDEAGRGPLAGPLVVAGVVLKKSMEGLGDSKKLSPKKREKLFGEIIQNSTYLIVCVDSTLIDETGLSRSINLALKKIVENIAADEYIFDGNSTFNVSGIKTMVKADTKIEEVMAASILAKVFRDHLMCDYARLYPEYNFCRHKGYGTKEHIERIKRYGLSPIHRESFRPKALLKTLF